MTLADEYCNSNAVNEKERLLCYRTSLHFCEMLKDLEKKRYLRTDLRAKKVKEHVAAVLPFQVLERIVDKPLRIRLVAIATGMSRNFNIYTPEELQAFAYHLPK